MLPAETWAEARKPSAKRAGRAYRPGGGRVCPRPPGPKAFAPVSLQVFYTRFSGRHASLIRGVPPAVGLWRRVHLEAMASRGSRTRVNSLRSKKPITMANTINFPDCPRLHMGRFIGVTNLSSWGWADSIHRAIDAWGHRQNKIAGDGGKTPLPVQLFRGESDQFRQFIRLDTRLARFSWCA